MDEGFTVWFTGLPRAGKTTVASLVAGHLKELGHKVEVLDGDVVRTHLSKGLGFSKEDRDTNIRRIGFVCQLLSRNGVIAIAAAISPYRAVRDEVRQSIGRFVEVFTKCPVEVCEQRDFKGHYERARRGEIDDFTGVSDPYEEPLHPEVICHTDVEFPEQSAIKVIQRLVHLQYLPQAAMDIRGEASTSPGYSREEEEEVKDRLRSLGYLD